MNEFQKSEQKGRLLFKSFLDQIGATGQPTEDQYDKVDYYFQVNGKKVVAELKVRNEYYDEYIIEEAKLQALQQKKIDKGLDGAFYICFYSNQMYVFTVSDILKYGIRQQKWCKRSTVLNNGYILKDVLLVPTNRATKFEQINGKWQK